MPHSSERPYISVFTSPQRSPYPFVDAALSLASELGNEAWYATWATINATCVDRSVAFSVVVLWAVVMYLGQFLKDSLYLPRPGLQRGSRVARLETHYAAEYGFPSTHTMGAASQPTTFLFLLLTLYSVHDAAVFAALIAFLLFWAVATPLSRFYLGVHSSLDVVGGFVLGVFPVLLIVPFRATLAAALSGPLGAAAVVALAIAAAAAYPLPRARWTNSPGDTVIVLFTAAGILAGFALTPEPSVPVLHTATAATAGAAGAGVASVVAHYRQVALPRGWQLALAVGRLAANVVLIYAMRLSLKAPVRALAGAVFGRPEDAADYVPPSPSSSQPVTPSSPADAAAADTQSESESESQSSASAAAAACELDAVAARAHKAAKGSHKIKTSAKASAKAKTAAASETATAPSAAKFGASTALWRRYMVEMSDKAVNYFLMGLVSVLWLPALFDSVGLAYQLPI